MKLKVIIFLNLLLTAIYLEMAMCASQDEQRKPRIAIFWDKTFPSEDALQIDGSQFRKTFDKSDADFLNTESLATQCSVSKYNVLVLPYGSAFPKEAWSSIVKFLQDGGNIVNLGGIPFSVPVRKRETGWHTEVHQTEYHKRLGITQAFPVSVSKVSSYRVNEDCLDKIISPEDFNSQEIYELYVRFTETTDFPNESGSAGARDAVLRSLVYGLAPNGIRVAAPCIYIDHLQGEFAGGRWVLVNFKGSMNVKAIRRLVEFARQGSSVLTARTSFACYQEGEIPTVVLQCRKPRGNVENLLDGKAHIEIVDDRGKRIESFPLQLEGKGEVASASLTMSKHHLLPGIYHVNVVQDVQSVSSNLKYKLSTSNGFWIFDKKLLEGGKSFTVDNNYLLRDGKPYIVTGTTYMGSDVHRKFLFEPNPHIWDKDFAEMKSAGINLVRTGIWTGWRNYMLDAGAPNEGAFRGLDAFLLTARKYNIPIIFTLFAFLPETWGGVNAYLDPRAIHAQKEFISTFAQRYRGVKDIIWDVINEPSFCNPQYLWSCRPNYDGFEMEAWMSWLKQRYPAFPETAWRANLQEMYREESDKNPELPKLDEFSNLNIFNDRNPVKVIDYHLFAQEQFRDWVHEMAEVIQSNSDNKQLVTVGQDEGGTNERPSPHFFSDAVDFTCVHNWWLNDDLVWDNVVMKVSNKPNLVEETGIMFYENMDGSAWRSEEEARNLLERKLAISIGADGAGFVNWIWNVNPFMKSDNEAAIGLFRVDGTAKPELEPMMQFSKFYASNQNLMVGKKESDVVMVLPHSQMYSTRNFGTEATRRSVRAMYYHCNIPMSAVSEYKLNSLQIVPKLIVVPSPRTLNEQAWQKLLSLVEAGSNVVISGTFDADDHWLPVARTKQLGVETVSKSITQEEFLSIGGTEYQLGFRGDKLERIEKAVVKGKEFAEVMTIPHGKGKFIWSPVPVELAEDVRATVGLYQYALKEIGYSPVFSVNEKNSSVVILPAVFEKAVLYTFVSECDRDTDIHLTHLETKTSLDVRVPAQQTELVFIDRRNGKILSSLKGIQK